MQTTFNLNPPLGIPGQMFDDGPKEVRSFPAASDTLFGTLCEVTTSGTVQAVQDSTTGGSFLPVLAGIALFNPMHEQAYVNAGGTAGNGYWRKGEMVPCLRRGRVFAAYDGGGTVGEYTAIRVWHSSDGTHLQGTFTMTAAATTAGAEIDLAPNCLGIVKDAATAAYTDFSGDSIQAAVVSINLAP